METPAEEEVKHEDNEWGKLEIVLSLIFITKIAVQEITVKLTKPWTPEILWNVIVRGSSQ